MPEGPQWVDEGPIRAEADRAVRRAGTSQNSGGGSRNTQRRASRAAERAKQHLEIDRRRLQKRLGPARAKRTIDRLGEATAAFAEDRYADALQLLRPTVKVLPDEPIVRELLGLTYYRLGKWKQAIAELEQFRRRGGSVEQHPVLADCHRALGNHDEVERLWEELAATSPSGPMVAEGRIVYAGSLADRGDTLEAIQVLESAPLGSGKLKDHHLRMRYVLADLYDRAGERQSARRYFESIARVDPGYFDVVDRLEQI